MKYLFVLVVLLFLSLSVVSASDNKIEHITEYTLEKTTPNTEKVVTSTEEKQIEKDVKNFNTTKKENKKINKKIIPQNTKTATVSITDYATLNNTLTNPDSEDITINILNNITLGGSTKVNNTIKTLTINGNQKTINGNNQYQFLIIPSETTININNITITNCNATDGGAIYNKGESLTITNSILINNSATNYGGAIYNNNTTMILTNNTFTHNSVTGEKYGGAIYNTKNATVILTNNTFTHNTAEYYGGAIYNNNATMSLTNNTLTNNTANSGGAIYNYNNATMTLTNNTLTNNTATATGNTHYGGGAIYNRNANMTLTNNTLTNNTATGYGGAVYNRDNATMTLNNNTLTQNNANNGGGAIYNRNSNIALTNNTLTQNNANYYGGAIYNNGTANMILTNNILTQNNANNSGAIYNNATTNINKIENTEFNNNTPANFIIEDNMIKLNSTDNFISIGNFTITTDNTTYTGNGLENLSKYNIPSDSENVKLILNGTDTKTTNNTFILKETKKEVNMTVTDNKNGTIKVNLTTNDNKSVPNAPVNVTLANGTIIADGITDENGTVNITIPLPPGTYNITVSYPGNKIYKNKTTTTSINIPKYTPVIKLAPIKCIIGENITLTASLTDKNENPITGGNLVFKLNGKTLRTDGRFDSTAPPLKIQVKNGTATYTITTDLYLRNAKNLTASHSGTSKYEESKNEAVQAQIQKRYANLTVTATPTKQQQYQTITFTATIKDTTRNDKNTALINQNTSVMFKVNGNTLKDDKGQIIYVPVDKDSKASYNYTIPAGTGGITANKEVRDYNVDAIFTGINYYPGSRNTTKFNVERSPITININEAKVNTANILSLNATIKDYKANNVIGTNKYTIKINSKSYTDNNGKAVYWNAKDGEINLSGIQIDPKTTIKRVMIVTGERQSYLEGRTETTNIIRTEYVCILI